MVKDICLELKMMSNLLIGDRSWMAIKFTDIFESISIAKSSDSNALKEGEIPFIGRSSLNNGFQGEYEIADEKIVLKNCITVSMVGEPRSFYQEFNFACSQNILILRNDERLNKYSSQFMCSIINNYLVSGGYGYGYPVGLSRVKRSKLLVPVDDDNNPDWQFMEDYIKQEQKVQAQKVVDYYEQKMIECGFELLGLEDVEWKEFKFDEIFKKIQRGKRLTKGNQIEGDTPYISSTAMNNGVDNFISNKENVRIFADCLTLANSGSVGSCFYHYYEFVASDHVTSLKLNEGDKYIYLFMASIIKRLEEKYSFNREINDKRIKQEKIILPTDEYGNPHYEYMRIFMQKLENENLSKVLEYIYIYI